MNFEIYVFQVGIGDCIIIHITLQNGSKKSIMIDCGLLTNEIEDFIVNTLESNIDYLFVTHIDNDHITGLISLLTKYKKITIGKILFNCFQHIPVSVPKKLTQEQKDRIEHLYTYLKKKDATVETKIGAKEALFFSNILRQNPKWYQIWEKKPICVESFPSLDLGELGIIEFISPTQRDLEILERKFKLEFARKFYEAYPDSDYSEKEDIYELLLRITDENEVQEYPIASDNCSFSTIERETLKDDSIDMTETNRASIAFIWSIDDKSFLFMGDAAPDVMLKGINNYKSRHGISRSDILIFDIIKMSHHGSSHNISSALMNVIDSPTYIFSGGNDYRPNLNTLAKIINRPLPSDRIVNRQLLFNTPHKWANELKKEEAKLNKDLPHFNVLFANKIIK